MKKIIVLIGHARSGKDTVADILQKYDPTIERDYFARTLKEQAQALGWNGEKDEKGRTLLQHLGDVVKEYYGDDYYVRTLVERIEKSDKQTFVITDMRFKEEYLGMNLLSPSKYDVTFIKVIRPETTGWNNGLTEAQKNHRSERDLDDVDVDCEIINDGTLKDLEEKVKKTI